MFKFLLKAANSLVSFILVLALCTAGTYAGYALWDNNQVYAAALDVQADMIRIKPVLEDEEEGASFDELLKINPDVCGWLTLAGTKIDHPLLQGDDNLEYVNKSVYGEFSLPGSLFLDTSNAKDFSDPYSLLYGHHMENSGMFGDLDLFKDESFFNENTAGGTLILPGHSFNLEIYACLVVEASDKNIFVPTKWQSDINGLISYAEQNAMHLNTKALDGFDEENKPQILAMSTCSNEFTNARTIVLAVMRPHKAITQEEELT